MPSAKDILGPMRIPFLVLGPICVLLGLGAAVYSGASIQLFEVILVLIGAICSHISVNVFNEYDDFRTGLDSRTQRTPFSGGSGTLQAKPELATSTLVTALIFTGIVIAIGIYFTLTKGIAILPLGLLGIFVIVAYTPWLTHNPFLCLIAPGLGFGPLMVMGTYFALTGEYSWTAFNASLVPFFLVSNVLLLNQFPDAAADKTVGRKHFPILIGRRLSSYIFASFLLLTYASIIIGVILQILPPWCLLGLLTLVLAVPLIRGSIQYADDIQKLFPSLGNNVLVDILTPILVAIGFFIH